ncbi:hypothetical protein ACOME3_000522 [Neoechinorhynchus agilis]
MDTKDIRSALKNKPVLILFGGPGSGKGTQCAKLAERYNALHISSGDLLREEIQSSSDLGKELSKIMAEGKLVPMKTVLNMILKKMVSEAGNYNGFLLDGYPRELDQAIELEKHIGEPTLLISFEVPDKVMIERLLGRAKTSNRVDDNMETIQKRLTVFHQQTMPVLNHYEQKKVVRKVYFAFTAYRR